MTSWMYAGARPDFAGRAGALPCDPRVPGRRCRLPTRRTRRVARLRGRSAYSLRDANRRRRRVPERVCGEGSVGRSRSRRRRGRATRPTLRQRPRCRESGRRPARRHGLPPHITIARLGRPQELSNWVRLLDTYAGPPWPVNEIELVASHLGEGPRRRPRHEVLATLPLGEPRSQRRTSYGSSQWRPLRMTFSRNVIRIVGHSDHYV